MSQSSARQGVAEAEGGVFLLGFVFLRQDPLKVLMEKCLGADFFAFRGKVLLGESRQEGAGAAGEPGRAAQPWGCAVGVWHDTSRSDWDCCPDVLGSSQTARRHLLWAANFSEKTSVP